MLKRTNALTVSAMIVLGVLVGILSSSPAQAQSTGVPDEQQALSPAVATVGTLAVKNWAFATDNTTESTTSTTFVQVPGMSVTFKVRAKQSFLINYCDEPFAGVAGSLIQVVARVDGVDASPGIVQLDGDADENGDGKWARAHCFSWIGPKVTPGTHSVQIFWLSFFGDTVFAHQRTLTVGYKKL